MIQNKLTFKQIKIIVNNCEERTVRQIAKMDGMGIDPKLVYDFQIYIGIDKPFGGEDFMKYKPEITVTKKQTKKHIPNIESEIASNIVRPKSEYSNMGNYNLMKMLGDED